MIKGCAMIRGCGVIRGVRGNKKKSSIVQKKRWGQESDLHSLMVLSISRAPEAIMFSVGWQAVHSTTSGGEELR
jgi:hypothetical protein